MIVCGLLLASAAVHGLSRQVVFQGLNATQSQTEGAIVKESLVRIANWANAAYCSEKHLIAWDCGPPCEIDGEQLDVKFYKSNLISGSALYLGIHEKTSSIVISYRG